MAAFIRHAHYVVSVSPGQMQDYVRTDDIGGGEGLRHLFAEKKALRRLFALVNGVNLKEIQKALFGITMFEDFARPTLRHAALKRKDEARARIANEHPEFWPASNGRSDFHEKGKFVINMVARIDKQKGVQYVIPFIRQILSMREDVVFLLGGGGDPKMVKELNDLVWEFPGRVGYPGGGVSDKDPIYHDLYVSGDVFLAASEFEPGGISPMEALAAAVIILASDVQGHKSTIKSLGVNEFGRPGTEDGFNGIRFPMNTGNFNETVHNMTIAFNILYTHWKHRDTDPLWNQMLENAIFSDNSWERTVSMARELFLYSLTGEPSHYEILHPQAEAQPTYNYKDLTVPSNFVSRMKQVRLRFKVTVERGDIKIDALDQDTEEWWRHRILLMIKSIFKFFPAPVRAEFNIEITSAPSRLQEIPTC